MENNFRFASASVSDRGLSDKRPVNEDSFAEMPQNGLFVVADGVGGAQAGEFASQMAVEVLTEAFQNLPENIDVEIAMRAAIEQANLGIYNASKELPQLASMATTLAAVHIAGNIATIGHVGDSRVYRIEPDGTLKRETNDHSVVEEEVRAGRMTEEQALSHPSRNVISRAVGAEDTVEPDLKTIMVEPGTMFLVCSDGITRHIGDQELERLFADEMDPRILCEQMKDLCYKRGAEDNLTAVIVRISSELAGSLASNANSEALARDEEAEEITAASARSPFESKVDDVATEAPAPSFEAAEPDHRTEDFADLSAELDDEAYLLNEPLETAEQEVERKGYESSSVMVPAVNEAVASPVMPTAASPLSYGAETNKASGGLMGRLLGYLLFLVIGAAIGFGGYYLWLQANPSPEVPVITETKSNNIPLTAFEEARREVDSDPSRYLAANAATPQDSEDHYLLGRADLLTGKYVEAKRQFDLAKERLADVEPANAKTLAAEIAIGLSIANNPTVAEALAKEVAAGVKAADPGSNTDGVNTNSRSR